MAELRWVLLALGILVIVAVYLFSQGVPQRWLAPLTALRRRRNETSARVEPDIGDDGVPAPEQWDPEEPEAEGPSDRPDAAPAETIVTLRFIPNDKKLTGDRVILALRAAGLKHGRYGIFHRHRDDFSEEPMFSVANLTEPGSFDMTNLTETIIPGMSFFMILPGHGNPLDRFDAMVATARELARELDADLRDDKGSSWSIQRERYVREEIIEYCHSLDRQSPFA